MSDGYQIGFSADIEQGMSGGALLNREGKLVGIIGKSSYHEVGFPNAYKFDNNFAPSLFPQELMENSSWAIPIEVAVNKWYSELSSNLAWNLPPSSTPIVSSNISKPLPVSEWNSKIEESRNPLPEPNSVIIVPTEISQRRVETDTKNNLEIKVEELQKNYRLSIRDNKNLQQFIFIQENPRVMRKTNVQTINLDQLNKNDIIVNFSVNNSCPGDIYSFFYSYNPKNNLYFFIQKLKLRALMAALAKLSFYGLMQ
jgi:hypothetical protein